MADEVLPHGVDQRRVRSAGTEEAKGEAGQRGRSERQEAARLARVQVEFARLRQGEAVPGPPPRSLAVERSGASPSFSELEGFARFD